MIEGLALSALNDIGLFLSHIKASDLHILIHGM